MRRLIVLALLVLLLVLTITPLASAHQAGPCGVVVPDEPGHSEFARHHIVPFAQEGALGNEGHKPGTHRGFSVCNPSGK